MLHTGMVRVSIDCREPQKAWGVISQIDSMPKWAVGVKKTIITSMAKKMGGTRKITLADDIIVERVVGWKSREYLSYIALEGLPVDWYHATMSVGSVLMWESYFGSNSMSDEKFEEFKKKLRSFYSDSLKNITSLF